MYIVTYTELSNKNAEGSRNGGLQLMSNYLHKPPKLLWLGSVKRGEQKVYLTARPPGEVISYVG